MNGKYVGSRPVKIQKATTTVRQVDIGAKKARELDTKKKAHTVGNKVCTRHFSKSVGLWLTLSVLQGPRYHRKERDLAPVHQALKGCHHPTHGCFQCACSRRIFSACLSYRQLGFFALLWVYTSQQAPSGS